MAPLFSILYIEMQSGIGDLGKGFGWFSVHFLRKFIVFKVHYLGLGFNIIVYTYR